jgi:dynein heavy chain
LLKNFSWTLTAPFKEEKFQRLVSDSIGNNYSPSASNVNMKQLLKRKSEEERFSKVSHTFAPCSSPPMSPATRRLFLTPPIPPLNIEGPLIDLDPVDMETKTIAKQITAKQRYWFYVEKGIKNVDLARLEPSTIKKIKSLIKPSLISRAETFESLLDEVKRHHCLSIKQSIVDYILLDDSERQRLMIPTLIERYKPKICRAPVPWHKSLTIPKEYLQYLQFGVFFSKRVVKLVC